MRFWLNPLIISFHTISRRLISPKSSFSLSFKSIPLPGLPVVFASSSNSASSCLLHWLEYHWKRSPPSPVNASLSLFLCILPIYVTHTHSPTIRQEHLHASHHLQSQVVLLPSRLLLFHASPAYTLSEDLILSLSFRYFFTAFNIISPLLQGHQEFPPESAIKKTNQIAWFFPHVFNDIFFDGIMYMKNIQYPINFW